MSLHPRSRRATGTAALVLAAALLAGCTHSHQQQARGLIEQGRYEEGLATLSAAAASSPGDLPLRAELLRRQEQAVTSLIAGAQSDFAAGRLDEAQAGYERAMKLPGGQARARSGLEAVTAERRHQAQVRQAATRLAAGDREAATALARAVLQENPSQREARALMRQIEEQRVRDALAGPQLKVKPHRPVTLEFREASLRSAITALSRSTGINFVFDKDVRPDAKTTIYANNVSVEDAIDLLLVTNQLEKKVISDNTILIYPSTQQKLRDYQELMIRSFYLENADAKQTLALLKTMLKTRDMFIDEKLNMLVMRDTPEAIRLAEKLVAAHDLAEPEVMLEIEVVEVTHSRLSELGVKWPDQANLGVLDANGAPLLLSELKGIRNDRITVTSPTATVNAKATDGDANILASPRIRVRNREKARIQIGDRVPVISSQTTVATGNLLSNETISYLDVGLKVEVEPNVHLDDEVAIKVGLEVSTLGEKTTTTNGSVAYRVGTRNANTVLRLKDGETQVLMGLIRDDERRAAARVPGIGELPVLSHLFGSHQSESQKTEVVLAVTPRVVRNLKRVEAQVAEFWSGTETSLRSAPLFARTMAQAPGASPAAMAPGATDARGAAAPVSTTPAISPAPVVDAADLLLYSWAGPTQAKVGEEVTLVLRAQTRQPVAGAALEFSFDPQALEFVRLAEGALLRRDGGSTAVNHQLDGGRLVARLARAGTGVSGEGDLIALTFRVREAEAPTEVQLSPLAASGPGQRALTTTAPAPHRVTLVR